MGERAAASRSAPAGRDRKVDLGRLLGPLGIDVRPRRPVADLCIDSREAVDGCAFFAIAGQRTDGHRHVADAVRNGARVVFRQVGCEIDLDDALRPDVDVIDVPDTRDLARRLAPAFYGHPTRRMRTLAVSGTNGKTTWTVLVERLSRALGRSTGVVNTLGIRYAGASFRLANHLPEPVVLQRTLADMADAGVATVVLEVTSYALAVDRVQGIDLDAAALTNVTQDHLDVHGTMERYLAAKLGLFDLLARSPKVSRTAVFWRDCAHCGTIRNRVAGRGCAQIVFAVGDDAGGAGGGRLLRAHGVRVDPRGTTFDLDWNGATVPALRTSLLGAFNVRNVLAALAAEPEFLDRLAAGDDPARELLDGVLADVRVPGRLEPVPNDRGATILVDYAHTDDGLLRVLETLRALPHRALITVFGCGGDRDREKRPLMGSVATRLSDFAFVTSDNPRTEEPGRILREIEAGIAPGARYAVVEDREQAIREALCLVREGDILLVAGRGHEQHQIIGTAAVPFLDGDVIRRNL
jgi:UDP-N-acetylmuramoyl-L-alanyl-D-glutamate--2,6-diaminopimelate ligase